MLLLASAMACAYPLSINGSRNGSRKRRNGQARSVFGGAPPISAIRFEFAIRKLIDRCEAFREMCEELAEAERALSMVDLVPLPLREERRAEWEQLVDRLVAEIGTALQDKDVVTRPHGNP
jgi:hypothetical protein